MKIPTVLATANIPDALPQAPVNAQLFGKNASLAAGVSQATSQIAQVGSDLATLERKQRTANAGLEVDEAIDNLKNDTDLSAQRIKQNGQPDLYAKDVIDEHEAASQAAASSLRYPEGKALFQKRANQLGVETAIKARAEGLRMQNAQTEVRDEALNLSDANEAVFGTSKFDRDAAYQRAVERINSRVATGIYSGEQGATKMRGFEGRVEEASIQRDASDPRQLPGVMDRILTGQYRHISPERGMALVDSLTNRQEKMIGLADRLFNEASGEVRKDYTAQLRGAAAPADFRAIETNILASKAQMNKGDFTEILGYVDTLKKAKASGESDQRVLTNVTQMVDEEKITKLSQLNSYAGDIAPHDIRALSDKITTKREKRETKAQTDQERRLTESRTLGEKYIRDVTTISSNLLAFDQMAKQVGGEQAYRFGTEALNINDVGQINDLARVRVAEARAALAEKLSFEGQKLYPLMGKYKTEQEVTAAYKAGEFGAVGSYEARTKSDNMINLQRFIDKLTASSEASATSAVTATATEGAGKSKSNDTRKTYEKVLPTAIGGKPAPKPPTTQDMAEPVRQAAEELYPGASMSELAADEAKLKKITERATQLLRGTK